MSTSITTVANPNIISAVNSSSVLLGANATFTGIFENVLQFQEISCFCISDVGGTLYLDFSVDGVNALVSFPFISTGSTFFRSPSSQAFARIRYVNGSTIQTQFTLTTIYRPVAGGTAQLPFSNPIFDVTLAGNARAVIFGKNSGGNYTQVGTDVNDGGLAIHVANPSVPVYIVDTVKSTYSATIHALVPAASATDIFVLQGSATKLIKLRKFSISGSQTGNSVTPIQLIKRSALDTGGTSTTITGVSHDSSSAGATAVVKAYTANPTLGVSVGAINSSQITFNNGLASGLEDTIDYTLADNLQPIILRNANENIAINFVGTSVTAGSINITVIWTEE